VRNGLPGLARLIRNRLPDLASLIRLGLRRPYLAGCGAGVLIAVAGVAVVLRSTGACALPPPPGAARAVPARAGAAPAGVARAVAAAPAVPAAAERTGRATFYGDAAPGGACSFPAPPADHLTAAAGPADFAGAAACGGYLEVTGKRGTVRVKVDNVCPECEPGHLDLSNEAFQRLDALGAGITPIHFHQVADPAVGSGLSFRVKEGSSRYWLALLVDQHGNPLRSVQVSGDGGRSWAALTRTSYNYWLAAGGAGPGPFSVRVTDDRGHVAQAAGIAIRPGVVQATPVRLYGAGAASGRSPGGTAATGTPGGTAATGTPGGTAAARTPTTRHSQTAARTPRAAQSQTAASGPGAPDQLAAASGARAPGGTGVAASSGAADQPRC
jgi:expansin (peptidoglycan-binding protein)